MAHADYNCCLICDCKMEYSDDSSTKARPCTYCLDRMRSNGTIILTSQELKEFVERVGDDKALAWLNGVGYQACYYDNDTDTFLKEHGLVLTDAKDGKWGNKLRPLE